MGGLHLEPQLYCDTLSLYMVFKWKRTACLQHIRSCFGSWSSCQLSTSHREYCSDRAIVAECELNGGFELGLTNSRILPKFVKIQWIRSGLNSKIIEFTVHKFKKIKKNKKWGKICKKLDKILRLLMKNFFFKSASFGWLKFKFRQICSNGH
jgi:hypothetical protein